MAHSSRDDDSRRTARIVSGRTADEPSPRAKAARSRLEAEGFAIEPVDDLHWRILRHSFWPEITMWRHPDGRLGQGGLPGLIKALIETRDAARFT